MSRQTDMQSLLYYLWEMDRFFRNIAKNSDAVKVTRLEWGDEMDLGTRVIDHWEDDQRAQVMHLSSDYVYIGLIE